MKTTDEILLELVEHLKQFPKAAGMNEKLDELTSDPEIQDGQNSIRIYTVQSLRRQGSD